MCGQNFRKILLIVSLSHIAPASFNHWFACLLSHGLQVHIPVCGCLPGVIGDGHRMSFLVCLYLVLVSSARVAKFNCPAWWASNIVQMQVPLTGHTIKTSGLVIYDWSNTFQTTLKVHDLNLLQPAAGLSSCLCSVNPFFPDTCRCFWILPPIRQTFLPRIMYQSSQQVRACQTCSGTLTNSGARFNSVHAIFLGCWPHRLTNWFAWPSV